MSTTTVSTRIRSFGRTLLLSALVTGGAACAGFNPRPATPAQEKMGRELTAEEIRGIDARTAYDAIRILRPEFLSWTRGAEYGMARVAIYIDHMRAQGPDELSRVPAESVRSVRLLRSWEATFEYGTNNNAGALEVLTYARGS